MKKSFLIYLSLAILMGLIIAWIDSRPNWDDAGISALMVLVAAALCAYLAKQRPWLIALSVGIWIPLFGIFFNQSFEGLLALLPAFIGAYVGYFIRSKIN